MARFRLLALPIGLALLGDAAGCARVPRAPGPANHSIHPTYRFLPPGGQALDDAGHLGFITDNARVVASLDGVVEVAPMRPVERLHGGVPIPTRLGRGFLFWTRDTLYRSRSYVSSLEAVAPIRLDDIALSFGQDAVLVIQGGERRAYDLERRTRVALSPHGMVDTAATEDKRVIALDAAGRALASIDGGRTWRDVSTSLGAPVGSLHGETNDAWFEPANDGIARASSLGAWLQPDGQIKLGPIRAVTSAPLAAQESRSTKDRMMRQAVTKGVPWENDQVLVAVGNAAGIVDLERGTTVGEPRAVSPAGTSCEAISADDEGLFVCAGRERPAPGHGDLLGAAFLTVVSHVLGGQPRVERRFEGTPAKSYGVASLLIGARCDGSDSPGVVCVRQSGGRWVEHDEQRLVDQAEYGTAVVFWAPREDGGVSAVIGRKGEWLTGVVHDPATPDGTPAITAFDEKVTGVDAPWFGVHKGSQTVTDWVVTRDGVLRGLTTTGSVAVDSHGHVTLGLPVLQGVSGSGGRALGRDENDRFWQSTDYGSTWTEVAGPPRNRGTLFADPSDCSLVGCLATTIVLGHNYDSFHGTVGVWLRIGWSPEPPTALSESDIERPFVAEVADALAVSPTSPSRPMMECVRRGGSQQLLSDRSPTKSDGVKRSLLDEMRTAVDAGLAGRQRSPGAPTVIGDGAVWAVVLGGRRLVQRQDGRDYANVDYRDAFYGPGGLEKPWGELGLRAVVHYETTPIALQQGVLRSVESKTPIEVLFTEDFDPSGRVSEAAGTFAQWRNILPSGLVFGFNDEVRPVMSPEPGHANGVLLVNNDVVFWVSGAGDIRPIPGGRQRCWVFGGYADAQGKLLLACGHFSGATSIQDAEDGTVQLGVPPVFAPVSPPPGRWREGTDSNPAWPNRAFRNADGIGVDKSGHLGILRLPSGMQPPTVDDPPWLLGNGPPVELAPWSTLQIATSAACTGRDDGVRAIVQTPSTWIDVSGGSGLFPNGGMSALVRWSRERVCLEAIEFDYRSHEVPHDTAHLADGKIIARFVGQNAGMAFVARDAQTEYREPVTCRLIGADAKH